MNNKILDVDKFRLALLKSGCSEKSVQEICKILDDTITYMHLSFKEKIEMHEKRIKVLEKNIDILYNNISTLSQATGHQVTYIKHVVIDS
jgi:hypothetical protein